MEQEIIYVKMTKVWAQFPIGEIVRFGKSKGLSRIELGMGHEVPKSEYDQQQKQRLAKKPQAETATNEPAAVTKEKIAAEAKARAETEAKANAEADAKANLELGPLSSDEKEYFEELLEQFTAKSGPNIGKLKANTPNDVIAEIENLQARANLTDNDNQGGE